METFVLLTVTGLGLGAMYFLIASGLSLIYGLMGVLNFAHGAFLTIGAYVSWWVTERLDGQIGSLGLRFLLGALAGLAAGAIVGTLVEVVLIRPLYRRPIEQVLVTVGLSLALIALVGPALKARPALVGAVAAGVVALLAHGLPYRLGLFVAAIVGIFAATLADDRRPRETAVDSGSTS